MLRVALVGCGIISEQHIRAYARHTDRARIVVCCDVEEARAAQRAAEIGPDVRVTTRFADVLNDPDVDSIELLTPHHLHPDAVIAAADAGKHILCQKPLAKSIAECDAMIDAANAAGITLYYGETNRTHPAAVAAAQAIAEGRIGKLVGLQASYAHWQGGIYMQTAWRYDPKITGGGQLLDGGIHAIDLLRHLGGDVDAVSCFTTRFRPELGGEDTASVSLRFAEGGHLGSFFASQAVGIWFPSAMMVVMGTEGALRLGGGYALSLHRPDLPNHHEVLLEHGSNDFVTMIGRYLDTVVDGAPNPSPGEVGRENLRVVLAAYESAHRGHEVALSEIA